MQSILLDTSRSRDRFNISNYATEPISRMSHTIVASLCTPSILFFRVKDLQKPTTEREACLGGLILFFLFIEMQLIYAGSASAEPVELIFYESVSRGLAYGLRRRLQLTRKDANSPPLLPPPLSPLVLLFFSGQNGTCNEPKTPSDGCT